MEISNAKKKSKESGDLRFYIILVSVLLVFVLCFQPVRVLGSSMESTLMDGDLLIMWRDWMVEEYEVGDIVVAAKDQFHNGEFIIKRIIAVEGQVVDIDDETGQVYVDGVLLIEDYVSSLTFTENEMMFPLTVEENCYFLLGDNRDNSIDSRCADIGLVHEDEIKGKVVFLLFPSTANGFQISRIGYVG